ncbi:MAG TPA: sensor domain-containing diguanylate cyclase [Luteimonas sp.]|nr:sensor domain-containing diguanylate cyclase [Luteimonas sp.]
MGPRTDSGDRRRREADRQRALAAVDILDSPPEQAYDDIVLLARIVCGAPAALIGFIDRERQWCKAAIGLPPADVPREDSPCELVARAADAVHVVRDLRTATPPAPCPVDEGGAPLRFLAGAPLRTPEGFVLGALCVLDHRPRGLTATQRAGLAVLERQVLQLLELRRVDREQRELLQQRAQAAQRLEHERAELQRRHDDLQREATHDPLTGLLNRAALGKLRANPRAMQRLGAGAYTLALVDIDHFKQVNDRHGHLLGDRALRAVAQVVAGGIREGDVAVRYGGEEFLLVLPDTPLAGAFEVAERIRGAAMELALPFALTVSIGLASGDPAADEPEQVFERADQALYRAKAGGRNRVVADEREWRG